MISLQNMNVKLCYIRGIPPSIVPVHVKGPRVQHLQPETRKSFKNPKPDGLDPTVRITEPNLAT